MELNWLQSLIYCFISGLTEFFPVSAEAHRKLCIAVFGVSSEESGLVFAVRLGCLAAVLLSTLPLIEKLYRERKFATMSRLRRKHQPDPRSLATLRVLMVAIFPALLGLVALRFFAPVTQYLWLLAIILVINGIALYIPQHFPSGNKDSLNLTTADSLLIGLAGAAGVVPGVSRIGMMSSVAGMRGADRRYSLDICLLICVPILLVLTVIDGFVMLIGGGLTGLVLLRYLCSAMMAFAGAYLSIITMRFLAFKSGFSGFAYYCWGLALTTFILYLVI